MNFLSVSSSQTVTLRPSFFGFGKVPWATHLIIVEWCTENILATSFFLSIFFILAPFGGCIVIPYHDEITKSNFSNPLELVGCTIMQQS